MSKRRRRIAPIDLGPPRPRTAEQLLIDALPEIAADRVLCTSLGRGQFAMRMAAERPQARVVCHFLDLYLAEQARECVVEPLENLNIVCTADLPSDEVDLVALPITRTGDAELTRDLMQSGFLSLRQGGRMAAATDNPRDSWLHGEMQTLFETVTRRPHWRGVFYLGTKSAPLKRVRNFDAEFVFRDGERLITGCSRPGVFSHRRLDLGTRALLEAMTIESGQRVLDLGCGAGVLSLAAALRVPDVQVASVDSNPRALQCVEHGAGKNGVSGISTALIADAQVEPAGAFDVVLTNPPYYSNFRIAELFLEGAQHALRPGGLVHVVTKRPDWFAQVMEDLIGEVAATEVRSYFVLTARRRRSR